VAPVGRSTAATAAMFGERRVTEDGHELTMQVNYLALQHLLHDRLSASGAHIVVTSSVAHRGGRIELDDLDFTTGRHSGSAAYNASKLADLLFAREIARRTPQTRITAVAFHPGNVRSRPGRQASGVSNLIYNTPVGRLILIDEESARPRWCTWLPSPTRTASTASTSTNSSPTPPPPSAPATPNSARRCGSGPKPCSACTMPSGSRRRARPEPDRRPARA
jgi:NAD(P)-dependent dehydrogenase (short-subunit alcohol dehydrogenase family)